MISLEKQNRASSRAFFAFAVAFFAFAETAQAFTVAPPLIDADTIWEKESGPYIIQSGMEIRTSAVLTVEPGTVIKLGTGSVPVDIFGGLDMGKIGSEPVVVTSLTDDSVGGDSLGDGPSSGGRGDWRAPFVFEEGSHGDIRNAIFRFGGRDACTPGCVRHGMIENAGGSVSIRRATLSDAIIGIIVGEGSTTISHSVLSNNVYSIYGSGTVSISVSDLDPGTLFAIFSPSSIDARNDWWGTAAGPSIQGSIPGIGRIPIEEISSEPWSSEPFDAGAGTGDQSEEAGPVVPACAAPCASSVLFLPGLEASRLYERDDAGEEKRLWEPSSFSDALIPRLFLDGAGKSVGSGIFTRDVVDEALAPVVGKNIYKSFITLMDDLKASGSIVDWEAAPYDWRLSIDDILESGKRTPWGISYLEPTSTPFIIQEIERLAASSKTCRTTVIAHSNGGLVAKALMRKLRELGREELVDKVVLIAVPQVGTPQAIGALLHGFDQGLPFSFWSFLLSPQAARKLGADMPGAYSLLPSKAYFDFVSDPVAVLRSGAAISTEAGLLDLLQGTDGREDATYDDLFSPSILSSPLLAQAEETHDLIDVWTPASSTRLIQIAGWGMDTVKGIRYFEDTSRGAPKGRYEALFTEDGDGTVVVPSALSTATTTENIERYWLDLKTLNRLRLVKTRHADILEEQPLRDLIADIIEGRPPAYTALSTSSPASSAPSKKLYFSLLSPERSFDIYDDEGRHTGISTSTGAIEEAVPDTEYGRFGAVSYISIESGARHRGRPPARIVIGPSPESFTLLVRESGGEEPASSTAFSDIPSSSTTTALLDIPETIDGLGSLQVDENGDGAPDFIVEPGQSPESETKEEEKPKEDAPAVINSPQKHMTTRHAQAPISTPLYTPADVMDQSLDRVLARYGIVAGERAPNDTKEGDMKEKEAKPTPKAAQTASAFLALDEPFWKPFFHDLASVIKSVFTRFWNVVW
jgi:pimeloyl-ACP methyl ester carboxylesterase